MRGAPQNCRVPGSLSTPSFLFIAGAQRGGSFLELALLPSITLYCSAAPRIMSSTLTHVLEKVKQSQKVRTKPDFASLLKSVTLKTFRLLFPLSNPHVLPLIPSHWFYY